MREAEYSVRLHKEMKKYKIDFATGVPCGAQKEIIRNLSHDSEILHIPSTREAEAIGIAAGAYMSGKNPVVYMQNSGLFDSSNDIASLLIPYKIPVFLSVTWRGCPGEDTPQHIITGSATISLLESLGVPYRILEKDRMEETLSYLFGKIRKDSVPVAMLVQRDWFR